MEPRNMRVVRVGQIVSAFSNFWVGARPAIVIYATPEASAVTVHVFLCPIADPRAMDVVESRPSKSVFQLVPLIEVLEGQGVIHGVHGREFEEGLTIVCALIEKFPGGDPPITFNPSSN